MKKKRSWPEDPVVREVREVRQRLWKEAGGTIKGLIKLCVLPAGVRNLWRRGEVTKDQRVVSASLLWIVSR